MILGITLHPNILKALILSTSYITRLILNFILLVIISAVLITSARVVDDIIFFKKYAIGRFPLNMPP